MVYGTIITPTILPVTTLGQIINVQGVPSYIVSIELLSIPLPTSVMAVLVSEA
jgi:hypothetical protein